MMQLSEDDTTQLSQNSRSSGQNELLDNSEAVFRQAIHDSSEVIIAATTVFGGQKIILTRSSFIYEKRSPLGAVVIKRTSIGDVNSVDGMVSLLFATLNLHHTSQDLPNQIGLFWRKDGIRLARILSGYIAALSRGLDIHTIPIEKLIPMLIEMGTADSSIR